MLAAPMMPRRYRRLREVLDRRQPDLTVLLDNVHKPHNLSAVLRSCDAVGVFEAHAVWPEGEIPTPRSIAQGTQKWVGVRTHPDLPAAVAALRAEGFRLVAAHPAPEAVDFRRVDLTRPVALVLGQEKDGLGEAALAAADQLVRIPMSGMVASLNVSVAAALLLFEAQRQRSEAGLYEHSRLPEAVYRDTLFEWCHPKLAARCRRENRPYPALDGEGRPIRSAG